MSINFLCVNSGKYSVTVCFSRIAIAIASRKHMRMGRRICFCVLCVVYRCRATVVGTSIERSFGALDGGRQDKKGEPKHCGSFLFLAKLVPVYSGSPLSYIHFEDLCG